MLFNSFEFLVFFPLVAILFFLFPHKFRWMLLLAASCIFYMAFIPAYILLLFVVILVDYGAGLAMEAVTGYKRRLFLVASIVSNVGILALFKYYNFFALAFGGRLPLLHLLLPIGLSFHTFQAMSYTIEVFRGNQKAERHLGIYALYVLFFPQLVAGPIERPQHMLPQFYEKKIFKYEDVTGGLRLMLWGFFKKVVIADRLATVTDVVFNHPHTQSPLSVLIGAVFFSFQIYADFSGYSDIAIGAARVMGCHLVRNFDMPYQSKSIAEFWRRWHISLSTWFRDYVYIPMGGSRVPVPRWYFNLLFVFVLSGFWHGANWTFLLWGALHGVYMITGLITRPLRQRITQISGIRRIAWLYALLQISGTFLLVAFAWIFFRANSLSDAFEMVQDLGGLPGEIGKGLSGRGLSPAVSGLGTGKLLFCFFLAIGLWITEYVYRRYDLKHLLYARPKILRWSLYYLLFMATLCLAVYSKRAFIYFQF